MSRENLILLILQFLKANNLALSFAELQNESAVPYNLVESHAELKNSILQGQWDKVMFMLKDCVLPNKISAILNEQIIKELCNNREFDFASFLLRKYAAVMLDYDKNSYSNLLECIKNKKSEIMKSPEILEKERLKVFSEIQKNTVEIGSPSKLLDLLQNGLLKDHQENMTMKKSVKSDNLSQIEQKEEIKEIPKKIAEKLNYVQIVEKQKKHEEKYFLQTAKFSPDGKFIFTGSVDGFIEILDAFSLELREDLIYQKEKKFMFHEKKILSLDFSNDGKMLCSGDESGVIKIWRINDGKCLRKLMNAHEGGVTCCKFMAGNSQVISGSYKFLIRIHGLKSGNMLREFIGHNSYVTDLILLDNENTLMSASADGTLKLWDTKSGILQKSFFPANLSKEITINSVQINPKNSNQFLICNRSNKLYVIDRLGSTIMRISAEKEGQGDFVAAEYSSDGKIIYAASQDLMLNIFDAESGKLENAKKCHSKEIVGISHHPKEIMLITYALDGYLYLWKP